MVHEISNSPGALPCGSRPALSSARLPYDTGDKAEYLRTEVRLACERPDPGPEFVARLRGFLGELDGARPGHRDMAA
ncbi:hypothetical protein [Streptomyces tuirus]|uniref:hypothetical protein n=1 Tax=Streptomyces tuirus TaxID=68278 RepID=UPI003F4DFBFE